MQIEKKYKILEKNNLIIISFDELFKDIEVNFLNDLEKYGLINDYEFNLSKKDVKKLLYHHIIFGICEEILHNEHSQRKVLSIPNHLNDEHQVFSFCNNDLFHVHINKIFTRLKSCLPFVIYFEEEFVFDSEINDTGEVKDIINILNEMVNNIENKTFTFEKIKKFAAQYDLEFLSREYFNDIKTKLLLR